MSGSRAYRPDIDGLRALAILPVLLFHSGAPGFGGGYIGVDIFFVISGYLICGIIAREVDAGDFSIMRFYERRVRRIMPALLAMIAAVLVVALVMFLPDDLAALPRTAIAAVLFVSNIQFFTEVGYFAGGAETKPLLHTWSLAVEEQFYIGFPILLLLLARYAPRWRLGVVWVAAIVSFTIAVATQNNADGFAFYLLPARAWELFAGALLALGAIPRIESRTSRELIAYTGVVAILFAVLSFDARTVFPGANALYPVFGAAALIHCAPGTAVGRLLATAPLRGIGLISYSLYLWHWPIIVFTIYGLQAPLSGWWSITVVAMSVLLAVLSWRFIEQPFRKSGHGGRARLFAGTGVAMATICAAAVALIGLGGMPGRFPADVVRMAGSAGDVSPMRNACHDSDANAGRPPCVLGARAKPTALLWGDSHGVEIAYELSRIAREDGRSLIQRTQSSCPPVLGYDPPTDTRCRKVNDAVMAAIRDDPSLQTIYLSASWASAAYEEAGLTTALDRTITALRGMGRNVVFIGAVPPQPFDVPRHLAREALLGRLDGVRGVALADVRYRTRWLDPVLVKWRDRGVTVVDPAAALCGSDACDIIRNGHPLYFDSHHLTLAGARIVADKVKSLEPGSLIVPVAVQTHCCALHDMRKSAECMTQCSAASKDGPSST